MFDFGHLGDSVGDRNQSWRSIASGDHEIHMLGPARDGGEYVCLVDPSPRAQVGEFVEDDQLMLTGCDEVFCLLPTSCCECLVVFDIARIPGEAVAERVPIKSERSADLLLAYFPFARLDELANRDLPSNRDPTQHHTERSRTLPFAIAGVDDDE